MIVDTSVVVKWFVPEVMSAEAQSLLDGIEPMAAPDFMPIEFGNVMWSKVRAGEFIEEDAILAFRMVTSGQRVELHSSAPLVDRAYQLARRLDHPLYDCVYLALAEQLDDVLMTADRRFVEAAAAVYPRVRMLGEPR